MARPSKTTSSGAAATEDAAFLERLADRYKGPLRSFFIKRLRADDPSADDLVQDVFLRLSRRGNLGALEQVDAYLFQTAANVLKDHLRKSSRGFQPQDLDPDADPESEEADAERVLIGRETVRAVIRALQTLPRRTRDIFVLNRFEGWSYARIAEELGVSVSAVEKHMMKALVHLARQTGRKR